MDEKMTTIGDWAPPDPSPRTLMSNFLNEEFDSFPVLEAEEGENGFDFSSSVSMEPRMFDGKNSSSRGGLAQRIARAGFNAPTINTACIRLANMDSSCQEVRSPYLTIPAGLSPTTLLDSPVFLSDAMVQPSPTTGKIPFTRSGSTAFSISASQLAVPEKSKDENLEDIVPGGFAFKPPLNTTSSYFSSLQDKVASSIVHQHSLKNVLVSVHQDDHPIDFCEPSDRKENLPMQSDSFVGNENSPPLDDQHGEGINQKGEFSSVTVTALADDGYNWRKYGQKQVKGSEYPRSYYKCTHPNCPVKKKVERSHEGHITEIVYKGAHNHAKPLPSRRSGMTSSHPFNDNGSDHPSLQANSDALEAASSDSTAADLCKPTASAQTHDGSYFGCSEAIDVSSNVSNDDEEEEHANLGSASLGDGEEEEESESKRRKVDVCTVDMSAASRAMREPRVVVQTTSEVDILDDGYRWRKYGQKVVKGNPNPRSYYKCTSPGCTVRKHVERASHDLKSVITTYEGKHNHDVPAARNSGHSNSGPSNAAPQPPVQLHQGFHRRPEPAQDGLMRFDGPPPLGAFSLGPGYSFTMGPTALRNFGFGGMGHIGQVKMPAFGSVGSYMSQQQAGANQVGLVVPKGEPKEEPVTESESSFTNRMAAYHQLMSRLPLGPQL